MSPAKRTTHLEWLSQAVKLQTSDCIPWPFRLSRDGYGKMGMLLNGKWTTQRAHRVAFFLVHGHWPTPVARHVTCDNRVCVNVAHLLEGTIGDNNRDAKRKGRNSRGEHRPAAKLTEEIVRQIRAEYIPRKVSARTLGKKYGVDKSIIFDAIHRVTWKHVSD